MYIVFQKLRFIIYVGLRQLILNYHIHLFEILRSSHVPATDLDVGDPLMSVTR